MRQTKSPIAERSAWKELGAQVFRVEHRLIRSVQYRASQAVGPAGYPGTREQGEPALSHESSANNLIYKIQNRKSNMIN